MPYNPEPKIGVPSDAALAAEHGTKMPAPKKSTKVKPLTTADIPKAPRKAAAKKVAGKKKGK